MDTFKETVDALDCLCEQYLRNRGTEHEFVSTKTLSNVPWYWVRAKEAVETGRAVLAANDEKENTWPSPLATMHAVACMIRDAANKYVDSKLQKDKEEFERLIRLFNLPQDQFLEAAIREVDRGV